MNRLLILNRSYLFLIVLGISCSTVLAQSLGYPFLKNFTAQDYKAHPQNFDIISGTDGLMYFANFAGVLQYDGHYWRLLPSNITSRITCLVSDQQGVIHCGAYGETGFLKTAPNGRMFFENHPLDKGILEGSGKDFFASFSTASGVIFVSSKAVVNVTTGKVWQAGEPIISAFCQASDIYLQLKSSGLVRFHDARTHAIPGGSYFSGAFEIRALLPLQAGALLVATSTQGLYTLDQSGLKPFTSNASEYLRAGIISSGILLGDHGFAFGTTREGIFILDKQGKMLQHINKKIGLNDDYIQNLYYDPNGLLWAAMSNGIAMMEIPAALNYFDDKAGLGGGVNDLCRFKGTLFAATNQGLFQYESQQVLFRQVSGIRTACWDLLPLDNQLLAACSEGLFFLNGTTINRRFEGFCLSLAEANQRVYIGTPDGLFTLPINGGAVEKIGGINEEVNNLITDRKGNIWGILASEQVFRFDPGLQQLQRYDTGSGLLETTGAALAFFDNKILALLRAGVFEYQENTDKFLKMSLIDSTDKLGDWFSLLAADETENPWVCSGDQKNIRRMLKKPGGYVSDIAALLPVSDRVIWCIFPETDGICWFGGPDGLLTYSRKAPGDASRAFPTLIRMVSLANDSVLFYGNLGGNHDKQTPDVPRVGHKYNTLRFDFSSPFYAPRGSTLYQYKLEGFDETWSEFLPLQRKEYTNLPHGDYVFRVRARNVYGLTGDESQYAFRVMAPLYLQWWAYVLYVLVAAGLFYLIVRLRSSQLRKEKRILEQKIEERTAQVTRQKEEIEQQSDELSRKNSELEKINTLVKSINSEINFNSLLQSLLEKMRMIRAVDRAMALVLDGNDQLFKCKAAFGWDATFTQNIRYTPQLAEEQFLEEAEEVHEDIFLKTKVNPAGKASQDDHAKPAKSTLIVVIKINDKIEAYVVLDNLIRENAFDNKDLSFIQHTKEHIIAAFIKTKILEDLQATLDNLKDAQDQLVQSEKLASLGQLTAGIAHEIQNPLNFVNNFSTLSLDLAKELRDLLNASKENLDKDTYLDLDEVVGMIEGNVQKINDHGKRASSIVKGMLQHSRGRSGEFEIVEINTLVEEYVNLAYHGMRAKDASFNTKITTNLDMEAGKVSVVPQDISRVILNIMNNACYAVSERSKRQEPGYAPEIQITTKKENKKIQIRIRDNGTGIPPHVLEKIFNPFFTTKPTGQGTGLGLSMSYDIITQLHKGKLEVNTEEGAFTEFVLVLPEKQ